MPQNSSLERSAPAAAVKTTALNMADAVGYLMRVAARAGLLNVAIKLAVIRNTLLVISTEGSEEAPPKSHSGSSFN